MFTWIFYTCRSQKRKKTVKSSVLLGSGHTKAAHKTLVKLTPGFNTSCVTVLSKGSWREWWIRCSPGRTSQPPAGRLRGSATTWPCSRSARWRCCCLALSSGKRLCPGLKSRWDDRNNVRPEKFNIVSSVSFDSVSGPAAIIWTQINCRQND